MVTHSERFDGSVGGTSVTTTNGIDGRPIQVFGATAGRAAHIRSASELVGLPEAVMKSMFDHGWTYYKWEDGHEVWAREQASPGARIGETDA